MTHHPFGGVGEAHSRFSAQAQQLFLQSPTMAAPPASVPPAVPSGIADGPVTGPAGPSRSLSWDAIRVIAVASVVIQHATHTVRQVMPMLPPLPIDYVVEAGANTLMVVSGYFLCVTLARRRPGRWWWNRIARLVPAYLVAVTITYAATLVASQFGYWHPGVRDLVGNLLLIGTWNPDIVAMDGSYWTMPLQIGVFTLAALGVTLVGAPGLRRHRATAPTLVWVGIVGPVVVGVLATGGLRLVYDGLIAFRWHLFALGLALWLAHRGRIGVGHLAMVVTAGVLAEYVLTPDLPSAVALALACTALGAAAVGPDWTFLRIGVLPRVLSWLASISFGVYLLNQQIGYFAAWVLEGALGVGGWARLGIVLALAVVLGWLLTIGVERPVHAVLTRPAGRQSGKDAAAARKRSFSSADPVETRTPSPANARTTTLFSSACAANAAAPSPRGSHTKFASETGTAYPSSARAATTRRRSVTTPAQSASSSSRRSSAASAAACAGELTENGTETDRSAATRSGGPAAKPTRSPASRWALENVRSTTSRGCAASSERPSGTRASVTNSR